MAVAPDPIIVALDLDGRERLLRIAETLRGEVETVKIGLEAYTHMGPEILMALTEMGFQVFADLKLNDIPNTVSGAVKGLVQKGAGMLTVHVSGGRRMMEAAVGAAKGESDRLGVTMPLVLGVTVLTSLDDAAVAEIGWSGNAADTVLSLAGLGLESGLQGVVASAREAADLRASLGTQAVIVTPGIRLQGGGHQDQARTASPAEALGAGADYLVVGRPVTASADPVAALHEIRTAAGLRGRA
ncbi:MAG: orotidine-5'-phosphate decarboxylase [Actinobacteria bacterium]|nr:MAG: orotidine-5'-phosphate decarboxylase [Actinomycetota bacterium]